MCQEHCVSTRQGGVLDVLWQGHNRDRLQEKSRGTNISWTKHIMDGSWCNTRSFATISHLVLVHAVMRLGWLALVRCQKDTLTIDELDAFNCDSREQGNHGLGDPLTRRIML